METIHHEGDNVEELYRIVGGVPGIIALGVAGSAIFWRYKFPQIGIAYLERELEHHRKEIEAADNDRRHLREDIKSLKNDLTDLENRYMEALEEKEAQAQELRHLRRQLRQPPPET